jgi:type II secretory pathway pseudopilin PulG
MKTRPGTTLLEVLAAIFIMGIGLLALLTLFPLGATSMSQAMKDARLVETGSNARSTLNALNLRQDTNVTKAFWTPGSQNWTPPTLDNALPDLPPDWNGASYPVFVDPVGLNYIGSTQRYLPGLPNKRMPRVSFTQATSGPAAMRWCSLWDDYTFDGNGSANLPTGAARESRYTWAYLMRRPNLQNPAVVEVSVVCYAGRNLQTPGGETAYKATYLPLLPKPKTVTITYTADKPNVKRGGWILDVTYHNPAGNLNDQTLARKFGPIHGFFYRVVDFTELAGNQIELELQTVPVTPIYDGSGINGQVVFLDNVAEVFPVGTGRP